MPASDLISRGLANKVGDRCTQISNLVQLDDKELALKGLASLAEFVWRFAETVEEDKARAKREETPS